MIKALLVVLLATISLGVSAPQISYACGGDGSRFLGIPRWDRGVDCDAIDEDNILDGNGDNPIFKIIGNIAEGIAIIGGYVAVIFVVVGGFKYVLSDGNPEKANDARKTIVNSLIGAGIAATAVIIVEVLFGILS